MAKGRIEQEIALKVTGAKEAKEAEKLVDKLDGQKAKVTIDVDDKTTDDVKSITKLLDGLTDKQKVIVLGAQTEQAERDIKKLTGQLGRAKDADTIALKVDLLGDAETRLKSLNDELEQLGKRGVDTSGVTRGLDDVAKSADSSKSVLANMIGNATQDLGALGGVAGSAGVAIGQMGEYMADAATNGDKFGTVLKNFALVAGPIALIATAVQVATGVMGEMAKAAEESDARVKSFGDAMAEAANDSVGLADVLRANSEELAEFNAHASTFGELLGDNLAVVARQIPLVGGLFKDTGADIIDIATKAGVSIYDLSAAIEAGGVAGGEFSKQLLAALAAGKITTKEYDALAEMVSKYGLEVRKAAKGQALFNVDVEEANALMGEIIAKEKPLERFTDQWATLFDDLRDGTVDTKAAADAINFLADQLGLDPHEVISLALDKIGEAAEANNQKMLDSATAIEEWAARTGQAFLDAEARAVNLANTQQIVDDLGSGFGVLASRASALKSVFDMKNAPLKALTQTQDLEQGIRDFADFIKDPNGLKGKIPDIFDPDDVNADDFLNEIDGLRGPIQQAITDAFASAGPEAGEATAQGYVDSIVDALDGKLTKEQVENLLGIADLTATIDVAINEDAKQRALDSLEALVGLKKGETPWSVSIEAGLKAGTITPAAAQLLIDQQLAGEGVLLPAGLQPPPTEEVIAEAQAIADQLPVDITVVPDTVTAEEDLEKWLTRQRNLKVNLELTPIKGRPFDGGSPSVPYPGGIAGERGPEIINDRWVTTGPTYVPPGTRVTSRRRTAVILRQHGGHRLRAYDAGGTVTPVVVSPTININAGAIGSTSDVMYAVYDSMRRANRLLPTVP